MEDPAVAGSSPHARGALSIRPSVAVLSRIIPACAGSTPGKSWKNCTIWDHPRMRGEHERFLKLADLLRGIIPACAGSTSTKSTSSALSGDHPRMRGEHGTPHFCSLSTYRIIPACAGSTCQRHTSRR